MNTWTDEELYAHLRDMWTSHDPVPPDLVESSIVAIESEGMAEEFELLAMSFADRELLGTRSGQTETPTVIEFSGEDFSVVIRISSVGPGVRRLDGWTDPPTSGTVRIPSADGEVTVPIDEHGRFEVSEHPAGAIRLWFDRPGGHRSSTPNFDV